MRKKGENSSPGWEAISVLVSLLTLVTLVVGQSVYELLAANPEFLRARSVGQEQLLEIVLVFTLLPALLLWLVWGICRQVQRRLAGGFLTAAVFFLALPLCFEIHNRYLDPGGDLGETYLLWLVPAGLVGWASLRYPKQFRFSLLVVSPIVIVFPAVFLARTWGAVPAAGAPSGSWAASATPAKEKDFPPIFLLVFDEFSLPILLDASGQIDEERFPHFAALAEESYWLRNATANASLTRQAVPALLTGTYPRGKDASFEAYPNNLFSWLDPYYDVHIYEYATHFCVPERHHCPNVWGQEQAGRLLLDVFYLYAARISPKSVELGLPDPTITWGPFRGLEEDIQARQRRFQRFLDAVGRSPAENVLYYFHHLLPHSPYALTPTGRVYETTYAQSRIIPDAVQGNRLALADLRDRYRMQVEYVDKEMGRFISRLQELGLYEKSVIVVTGDHGISWEPASPGRRLNPSNARLILSVPLFLKVPFQEEGGPILRDVQHIDLLPTLAEVLDLSLPWSSDGRSFFAADSAERKKVAFQRDTRFEFPQTLGLESSPTTTEPADEEPPSPWIGQPVETFSVIEHDPEGFYFDPVILSPVSGRQGDRGAVVYVTGLIDPSRTPVPEKIAVALNGKIIAVVPPRGRDPEGKPRLWTSFPSHLLQAGHNVIEFYVVLDAEQRKLGLLERFTRRLTRSALVPPD